MAEERRKQRAPRRMEQDPPGQNEIDFFREENGSRKGREDSESKKGPHRARTVVLSLILILLAGLTVYIHTVSPGGAVEWTGNFLAGFHTGDGFPVTVAGSTVRQIAISGNAIVALTDASLIEYNSSGYTIYDRQHGYANPYVETSSSRRLLYDRGGKSLRVENKEKILFETSMDQSIITADMGANGTFAVATRSKGYTAQVTVYNTGFEEVYTWYSVEQISAVAVSSDGKSIAVATLSAEKAEYKSGIHFFQMDKTDPVAEQDYAGTVFFSLEYKSDGSLIAVGDKLVSCLGKDGSDKNDYDFGGKHLVRYDNSESRGVAVYLSGDNLSQSGQMQVIFPSGIGPVLDLTGGVKDMALYKDSLYVLVDETLKEYDFDGSVQKEWPLEQETMDIKGYRSSVLVLYPGEIALLD